MEHANNPPDFAVIPVNLQYVEAYAIDTAYIRTQDVNESFRAYKQLVYNTILYYLQPPQEAP
jgi:hypothetical protein